MTSQILVDRLSHASPVALASTAALVLVAALIMGLFSSSKQFETAGKVRKEHQLKENDHD